MDTIFMNSENSKTSDPHRILLNLQDKTNLKRSNKLYNYTQHLLYMEKIKESYKDNKCKTSAPMWNNKFELPDVSCSVSDIQDYFEYILRKHG